MASARSSAVAGALRPRRLSSGGVILAFLVQQLGAPLRDGSV